MPNFHTHTFRCNHCKGDVEDYVSAAKAEGADILGFADHAPLPPGRWSEHRMRIDELEQYLDAIDESRKKNPDMRLYAGLECEYSESLLQYLDENIFKNSRFDFLIGAEHWVPFRGDWVFVDDVSTVQHLVAYAENQTAMMESGYFLFIAHPDLFMQGYQSWDSNAKACARDILAVAESLRVPVEINGNGFSSTDIRTELGVDKKYPYDSFWETASEYDVQAVCSTDAHDPSEVVSPLAKCMEIVCRYGLTVVDPETLL